MTKQIKNGDRVSFTTGMQVPESPLPSNAIITGTVIDAGTCALYPSNPSVLTAYGRIEVLRSELSHCDEAAQ